MIIENFDDFYDHYQGFSAYVAFCITEDYELSKDISQEVFLALFKVKEKLDYSRPDKLKALVMKATSNKCMDYYRKASSRQESYTIDDEENEIGVRCVAAPIFDYRGNMIAAVSAAGFLDMFPKEKIEKIGECVKKCAKKISRSMGYR